MMQRYVALMRLERPGGFVEPGELVRLAPETAEVLLGLGAVAEESREGAKSAKGHPSTAGQATARVAPTPQDADDEAAG